MSLFITLEGPDGSGKTTVTKNIESYFKSKQIPFVLTREPGGIGISEKIREIILDVEHDTMDDRTEALLYAASRRQHLIEKILPALKEDKVVWCERFVDSSLAYQGVGRGIGMEAVLSINLFAIEHHMPDVTFFLDISPEEGLKRVGKRAAEDRLELAGDAFHKRVYEGYQEIIKNNPERIVVIDATQSPEKVVHDIIDVLEGRFGL